MNKISCRNKLFRLFIDDVKKMCQLHSYDTDCPLRAAAYSAGMNGMNQRRAHTGDDRQRLAQQKKWEKMRANCEKGRKCLRLFPRTHGGSVCFGFFAGIPFVSSQKLIHLIGINF